MNNRIVADGRERLIEAIEQEVFAKYSDRLRRSNGSEREHLLQKIRTEIRDRIKEEAPRDALYFQS